MSMSPYAFLIVYVKEVKPIGEQADKQLKHNGYMYLAPGESIHSSEIQDRSPEGSKGWFFTPITMN